MSASETGTILRKTVMSNEPTTNLNISGVPVSLLPEIDAISDIRSKAVVTLLKEAIEARRPTTKAPKSKPERK